MAHYYHSIVIDAPIDFVWPYVRAFDKPNVLLDNPPPLPLITPEGTKPDQVGVLRTFEARQISESLLALDDQTHTLKYRYEKHPNPAIIGGFATLQLFPVTVGNRTFLSWQWVIPGMDQKAVDELYSVRGEWLIKAKEVVEGKYKNTKL